MTKPFIIGRHRLLVGDVTTGVTTTMLGPSELSVLMDGELADVVYVDPPWGPAILKSFAKAAGKSSLPWRGFLDKFAESVAAIAKPEAPIFVEMGERWTDDLDEAMALFRRPLRRRWRTTYGSRKDARPATVALYGVENHVAEGVSFCDTPHGEEVTRELLKAVVGPALVVLDPCTGLGMTARVTHSLGGCFRGLELNPARLEETARWLRLHGQM